MKHILPILAVSLLALLSGTERSNAEITYPWCAEYGMGGLGGGGRNCGFWTYEQCQATISGVGGYCEINAWYQGQQPGMIPPTYAIPSNAYARERGRRR
jgi:Protein of unknown function (DUF3551)